jgi:hypothetical protein
MLEAAGDANYCNSVINEQESLTGSCQSDPVLDKRLLYNNMPLQVTDQRIWCSRAGSALKKRKIGLYLRLPNVNANFGNFNNSF